MLRFSHPLWNASAQNEGGYANFAYPENLVKIGPVHSEIIGLQGTVNKTVIPSERKPCRV